MSFGSCHGACILRPLTCFHLWRYPVIWSCVIVLADKLKDFILLNNLITIHYNSVCSIYSKFTELFCWALLLLLVSPLVPFYTLILMVSMDSESYSSSPPLLGLICRENLFLHCSTCFAVSFCICALWVLDPETWFPALPLMQISLYLPQSLSWSIMIYSEADHLYQN